jgi:hypothetical protein
MTISELKIAVRRYMTNATRDDVRWDALYTRRNRTIVYLACRMSNFVGLPFSGGEGDRIISDIPSRELDRHWLRSLIGCAVGNLIR